LIDHLCGTRALLESWDADEWLCDAGLFHSVYGTESFRQVSIPLDLRGQVREVIGIRAERMAYVFGAMTMASFESNAGRTGGFSLSDRFDGSAITLTGQEWSGLCELFIANALEQRSAIPLERQRRFFEKFRWVTAHVSDLAADAFVEANPQCK
jgi:hypothetical protein